MKNIRIIGTALLFVLFFSACDNNIYDTSNDLQAIGDVFVRCTKQGNDTVYAPVFYVYSNFNMKEVTVDGPSDSNIEENLSPFKAKTIYRLTPDSSNFKNIDVVNGTYQFDIVSEDLKSYRITDKLLETRIAPVNITNFNYNQTLHSFTIDWDNVGNADVYVVKIYDEIDGNLIYVSQRTTLPSYQVKPGTSNWTDFETVQGATYVLGVFAYKFELPSANSGYDINCESVEYREFEW